MKDTSAFCLPFFEYYRVFNCIFLKYEIDYKLNQIHHSSIPEDVKFNPNCRGSSEQNTFTKLYCNTLYSLL